MKRKEYVMDKVQEIISLLDNLDEERYGDMNIVASVSTENGKGKHYIHADDEEVLNLAADVVSCICFDSNLDVEDILSQIVDLVRERTEKRRRKGLRIVECPGCGAEAEL